MSNKQMRQEFEHWAATFKDAVHGLPYFTIRKEDGTYVDGSTNTAWDAWQAAREATGEGHEIEHPPERKPMICGG